MCALILLHDRQPPRLLFFGNVIVQYCSAGVFGRREYLKLKIESYSTSSSRLSVACEILFRLARETRR